MPCRYDINDWLSLRMQTQLYNEPGMSQCIFDVDLKVSWRRHTPGWAHDLPAFMPTKQQLVNRSQKTVPIMWINQPVDCIAFQHFDADGVAVRSM